MKELLLEIEELRDNLMKQTSMKEDNIANYLVGGISDPNSEAMQKL